MKTSILHVHSTVHNIHVIKPILFSILSLIRVGMYRNSISQLKLYVGEYIIFHWPISLGPMNKLRDLFPQKNRVALQLII